MRLTVAVACLVVAAFGTFAASPADAQWRALGLAGHHVNRLSVHGEHLYACTDDGLYRHWLGSTQLYWEPYGFGGERVLDLVGIGPFTLLAAKQLTFDPADTISLFRGDAVFYGWDPFQNGFGAGGGTGDRQARRLLPLSGIPGTVLATSWRIEKSTDSGASWRVVGPPEAVINAIEQSPVSPGLIWAGGETAIFSPYVYRSGDAGETWMKFNLSAGGDNAVDAIAPHPTDSSQVYVGMEGRVMMSRDDGATWWTMTSPDPTIYTFGMAARAYLPLKLYAAGASSTPPPMVTLHTSLTGGLKWNPSSYGGLPGDRNVYHLLWYAGSGSEVVFIATGSGVYSYTEATTGVPVSENAPAPALRGHPNPFRGSTELEFAVEAPEAVSLQVVDVQGRVVARLVRTTLSAGPHRAVLDAQDLPAGIYFARLRSRSHDESIKLVHFR